MPHRCCINGRAASTSGPQAPQTETGIIFRTRPCRVLTERVRTSGGGGGGRAREAGAWGRLAAFFAFLPGSGSRDSGLSPGALQGFDQEVRGPGAVFHTESCAYLSRRPDNGRPDITPVVATRYGPLKPAPYLGGNPVYLAIHRRGGLHGAAVKRSG